MLGKLFDTVAVRWMLQKDWPDVIRISQQSRECPLAQKDLIDLLTHKNIAGMVVEEARKICGYMIYRQRPKKLELICFAVDGDQQRCGYGRRMIEKLMYKLLQQRRDEIVVGVLESNLAAQLFFRSLGFTAILVNDQCREQFGEDVYVMSYIHRIES